MGGGGSWGGGGTNFSRVGTNFSREGLLGGAGSTQGGEFLQFVWGSDFRLFFAGAVYF